MNNHIDDFNFDESEYHGSEIETMPALRDSVNSSESGDSSSSGNGRVSNCGPRQSINTRRFFRPNPEVP